MPGITYIPQQQNPFVMNFFQMLQNAALQKASQNFRARQAEVDRNWREKEFDRQLRLKNQGLTADRTVIIDGKKIGYYVGGKFYRVTPRAGVSFRKMSRSKLENGVLFKQEYTFNPKTEEERVVKDWTPVFDYSKRKASPNWQNKKRVYLENGKAMVQEYDYNPKSRKRINVGKPYEAPKTMGFLQMLLSQGATSVDMKSDTGVEPGAPLTPEEEARLEELRSKMNQ